MAVITTVEVTCTKCGKQGYIVLEKGKIDFAVYSRPKDYPQVLRFYLSKGLELCQEHAKEFAEWLRGDREVLCTLEQFK